MGLYAVYLPIVSPAPAVYFTLERYAVYLPIVSPTPAVYFTMERYAVYLPIVSPAPAVYFTMERYAVYLPLLHSEMLAYNSLLAQREVRVCLGRMVFVCVCPRARHTRGEL